MYIYPLHYIPIPCHFTLLCVVAVLHTPVVLYKVSCLLFLQAYLVLLCVQPHQPTQVVLFANSMIDIKRPVVFPTNDILSLFPSLGEVMPGKAKNQKEKENKGLFSKFRKSRKNSDQVLFGALIMQRSWCFGKYPSEGGFFTLVCHWLACTLVFVLLSLLWLDVCSYKGHDGQCPGFSGARE